MFFRGEGEIDPRSVALPFSLAPQPGWTCGLHSLCSVRSTKEVAGRPRTPYSEHTCEIHSLPVATGIGNHNPLYELAGGRVKKGSVHSGLRCSCRLQSVGRVPGEHWRGANKAGPSPVHAIANRPPKAGQIHPPATPRPENKTIITNTNEPSQVKLRPCLGCK